MKIIFSLCLMLVGCSWFEKPKHQPSVPAANDKVSDLVQKNAAVADALLSDSDQMTHWPSLIDCDATLWAGLALSTGLQVALELAEYSGGEIHRRPLVSGECYPAGSKSTVSNDMLLGYMAGKWAARDLPALQRLGDYAEVHNWVMGEGDAARTVMRPNGQGLLGRMIFALSAGADDRSYRKIPPLFLPVVEDYEKHLLVEGIMLNGQVNEYLRVNNLGGGLGLLDVNSQDLARLQELSESEPSDALVQAALGTYTGDFDRAITLLLDDATPPPTYARAAEANGTRNYQRVHWLKSASFVLARFPRGE